MKKVIVIGCPGSGKSVFSRELARRTRLPLVHLDKIYHQDVWDADKETKRRQWREKITGLIGGGEWIIDGNYKGTLDVRVPAADTVVFLDYPRWLCLSRALGRHVRHRSSMRPDMPEGWKERLSPDFLRFIWAYRWLERPGVLRLLEEYRDGRGILVFRRPAEAASFLEAL